VSKVMFGLTFMSFGQLVQDSAAYSWKNEPNNRVAVHGTVIPMQHLIVLMSGGASDHCARNRKQQSIH